MRGGGAPVPVAARLPVVAAAPPPLPARAVARMHCTALSFGRPLLSRPRRSFLPCRARGFLYCFFPLQRPAPCPPLPARECPIRGAAPERPATPRAYEHGTIAVSLCTRTLGGASGVGAWACGRYERCGVAGRSAPTCGARGAEHCRSAAGWMMGGHAQTCHPIGRCFRNPFTSHLFECTYPSLQTPDSAGRLLHQQLWPRPAVWRHAREYKTISKLS
jgi:hypothetical protein